MSRSPLTVCLAASLLAGLPSRSAAQDSAVDAGVWLVGGTGRVYGHRDIGNDSRSFIIDLNPRVGYFLVPHLAVTANLQYLRGRNDIGWTRTVGLGPGLSYYFGGPTSRVLPYLTGRTLFQWVRAAPHDEPTAVFDRQSTWVLGGGLSWLVARNVGLTAEFFYQRSDVRAERLDWVGENSDEQYGMQFGATIFAY